MLEEAKDKIQVATNNMATSIGGVIKTSGGTNIVDSILDPDHGCPLRGGQERVFFCLQGYNTCGVMPPNPAREGTDIGDTKDANGVYFVRELMDNAKKGGGFVRYIFDKPGKGQQPRSAMRP